MNNDRRKPQPVSIQEAYDHYWNGYQKGTYSFTRLLVIHRDSLKTRKTWEKCWKEYPWQCRETLTNAMRALGRVIQDIRESQYVFAPVPESAETLDLAMEERKITIAHRAYASSCRRSMSGIGDGYLHNVRAYLINRVEQASGHDLIVELEDDDNAAAKVRNRKEYLREKYGSCEDSLCLNCTDEPDSHSCPWTKRMGIS